MEFFKKAASYIGKETDAALKAREARLSTPDFQAKMAQEKLKLNGELKQLGNETFAAGSAMVVEGVLRPFQIAFKLTADKNYKAGDAMVDGGKAIGKIGGGILKSAASLGLVGGRLLKIAVRRGIAK